MAVILAKMDLILPSFEGIDGNNKVGCSGRTAFSRSLTVLEVTFGQNGYVVSYFPGH